MRGARLPWEGLAVAGAGRLRGIPREREQTRKRRRCIRHHGRTPTVGIFCAACIPHPERWRGKLVEAVLGLSSAMGAREWLPQRRRLRWSRLPPPKERRPR